MDWLFMILKHFMGLTYYGVNWKIMGLTSRGRTHCGVKPLASIYYTHTETVIILVAFLFLIFNLSKKASLNTKRRQSSSDKKHNLSLRLVLYPISEMFFIFFKRKTLREKLSLLSVCQAALQVPIKVGNLGVNRTHLCGLWLDISFFSLVKTIIGSSDWLELNCVWKFKAQFFGEYFSVMLTI